MECVLLLLPFFCIVVFDLLAENIWKHLRACLQCYSFNLLMVTFLLFLSSSSTLVLLRCPGVEEEEEEEGGGKVLFSSTDAIEPAQGGAM